MKIQNHFIAAMIAACVLPVAAHAQDASSDVRIKHCVVSIVNEAQVPAEFPARIEGGVISDLPVKEGGLVKAGQLIAQIDDREALLMKALAQFRYDSAKKEADSRVNIDAAEKTRQVAEAEYEEGKEINERSPGSVTAAELRRLKLTEERAGLQGLVAVMEHEVAGITRDSSEIELRLATEHVEKLKIKSPIDGVVVQRYRQRGEWVRTGDPVMHIVDVHNLRVEGFVDASEYSPQDIYGKSVTIEVELTRGRIVKYDATLNYVSSLVEASGDYRVWADIENKQSNGFWELRPGLPADIVIHMN